jgi:hypothetical protein
VQLYNIKRNLFVLLGCITIIYVTGCSDPAKEALETTDPEKGRRLVKKISNQKELAKIATEANHYEICEAAVTKLTDQAELSKATVEAERLRTCYGAVMKLTDQAAIARIALKDPKRHVRMPAAERLTNHIILAKIALGDEYWRVRKVAFEKLIDLTVSIGAAEEMEDKRLQLIYKIIRAFDNVPHEHQTRLMSNISPALRVLINSEVENIFGEIVSIKTEWAARSASYIGLGSVPGEYFQCSVKLKNLPESLSHFWETNFDERTTSPGFQRALINAGDLLEPAFELLPQPVLKNIAAWDDSKDIRQAAVKKLAD